MAPALLSPIDRGVPQQQEIGEVQTAIAALFDNLSPNVCARVDVFHIDWFWDTENTNSAVLLVNPVVQLLANLLNLRLDL